MTIINSIISNLIRKHDDRKRMKKIQSLKNRGMVVGDNFHMYNSEIDWKYCNLITIGNNVSIY